jgi:PAS domain S-box-containing protein
LIASVNDLTLCPPLATVAGANVSDSAITFNGLVPGSEPAFRALHAGRIVNSGHRDVTIPADILLKWQRIIDLAANVMQVPSGVITAIEPPYQSYTTIVSSHTNGNPFPVDEIFSMKIGTFCETVIKQKRPVRVANATLDEEWKNAPECGVGAVSYLGFPVCWPDGLVFGTICVLDLKTNGYSDLYQELLEQCRDVLQADLDSLVRMSSELEEQKAHLSELFARVPEAIVMVDRASRITRVNPEFTKIFGYSANEALGQRIDDLIAPEDLLEEAKRNTARMFQTGEVFGAETFRRHKSGARVPVALMCVPVSSRGGHDAGYVIYRDMTESKRLQNEQRRYHEIQLELAHANRIATIAQLSASIAHELNQPLTGIITNCGTCEAMLATEPPNLDGAREAVRRTIRDGNRAADVIARLRALFSRKEPASETVDLNEATREVLALSLADFQKSQVVVRTELADDLQTVAADRVQLQQVVLNLLRNALDAMSAVEDRPRELLIKTERDADDNVRLSVKDAGVGFDPQIKEKLFEAFYSTKDDGMGVGLSVCRSIIENHQGHLWAALNDGPGATFSFSVPRQAP